MSVSNTHYGAKVIEKMLASCRSVYFIGIGGVSMSSLACLTALDGKKVAGSDRTLSPLTDKLAAAGIEVFCGHDARRLDSFDAAVYTVAITPDNEEYLRAKERNIPLISRADYLGYIMTRRENRIGVSGMHGKSTCTSMFASVYMRAGRDPTVLSGADYPPMGGYFRIGEGKDLIFEACEYMDSFLDFSPTTAVILNVELEHVDYFGNIENIRQSFGKFAALTGKNGRVIVNADDSDACLSLSSYTGTKVTFGIEKEADYTAKNITFDRGSSEFDIMKSGELLCRVAMKVPGRHNIYDALAVAAAADLDGIAAEDIAAGLADFTGAKRRMQYRGMLNGAPVYDDYGHHPTEIAATLSGAREMCGNRSLVCVFQPHTYSRLAALFDGFVSSLSLADRVMVAPVYAARETDTLGTGSCKLAAAIGKKACAPDSLDATAGMLKEELDGDCFAVIMGAGDIEDIFGILFGEGLK